MPSERKDGVPTNLSIPFLLSIRKIHSSFVEICPWVQKTKYYFQTSLDMDLMIQQPKADAKPFSLIKLNFAKSEAWLVPLPISK